MDKTLKLYIYVDGVSDTPFPQDAEEPLEIGAFRYDAKRMGGAPTITASVNYPSCLDDEWTNNVYAEFNGEKYYLKQTPTSSYSNDDNRYKHNIELISERAILDDVYFFDVVTGNPQGDDKPVSNSSKVTFFGNIREFVSRLNSSLQYSNINYSVVVDDEIETEDKLMSFEDQFFSNVLKEIYNTYKVPYYFDGKTIHVGYAKSDVITPDLSYGVDNALLSITKNNANYKTVNRATGYGSSENLTFYYPNNSPKGDITFEVNAAGENLDVSIIDYERYSDKVGIDEAATFVGNHCEVTATYVGDSDSFVHTSYNEGAEYRRRAEYKNGSYRTIFRKVIQADGETKINFTTFFSLLRIDEWINSEAEYKKVEGDQEIKYHATVRFSHKGEVIETHTDVEDGSSFVFPVHERGSYFIDTEVVFIQPYSTSGAFNHLYGVLKYHSFVNVKEGWFLGRQSVELKDIGIHCAGTPTVGDTITQRLARYVNTSKNLMPSIYRQSDAKERFYNAINYPFTFVDGYELNYGEYVSNGQVHNDAYKDDEGNYIRFDRPYVEGKAKEHIVAVEDLMPTITGAVNANGLRMDMFSEFAYDDDDNDETLPEEDSSDRKFLHAYFFGKLRKLDFNLFDHAIEQQPMTVSFTSGDCGACNFEIGVSDEFPNKNPVLVNADGTLKRDSNGRVICGQFQKIKESELQDRQQDTINNEVWIALKKEDTTYGILMPKAEIYEKDENGNIVYDENGKAVVKEAGHRPKPCTEGQNDGDTFVILGINLPESYIINAEKKLEAEIIKYMKENNDEKFTFNIDFSRIYFAENESVLKSLNENSKVRIIYDNKPYDLYVSSFSYTMSDGDILPDIKVELDDTLKVSDNPIRNAINDVKSELGKAINNVDVVGIGTPYFLRKDGNDEARGQINFRKGLTFGNGGNGGKIDMLDGNSAKLTIDYIEVKKKATFTSLEIQEKSHVGGQMLITPAAMRCSRVEEFDNYYRCYFQTRGEDGDEIFNQFAVGDQAICQTYNAWGSKYYWRLVTGIGEDYIDLSKTECDEDSGIPSAGDKIIQLGNQADTERQNAIVIAAYGDGSPYIIQYKGINNFELPDDKIVTKLSSTENIFTGKVHMEMGSDGLGDMQEFVDLQTLAGKANTNATNAQSKANTAIATADMAQQSADTANKNALQAGDAANAATEKAEEAIGKAAAAQEGLDNIEIGGTNLLRNSGFTGDYLSEQLADEKVLEGAAELYSSPLDHWSSTATTVINSDDTISGKAVSLTSGTLSQELYYNTVVGAEYVLSFKAKGEGILSFTVGDANGSVSLTSEMTSYEVVVTPTTSSDIFRISNATCTLGNLKLEKGNKASAWSASPLDNASDRAYYQSMKYIQNAFDGATDIEGGLVLTEQIWVGDYDTDNKKWVKMNGGMSGVYESDHDVAFWAGGNINQAIETVMMYADDPTFQPTEDQLASMANFVVTHGGKAILNEAVVKGTIYASDGEFTGKVNAKEGTFKGNVSAQYGNVGCMDIGDDNVSVDYKTSSLRNHSSIRSNYGIAFHSKDKSDNTEVNCSFGYKSVQSSSYTYDLNGNLLSDSPLIQYRPGLCVEVDSKRTTPYDYLNAIYVSMTGAKENNAIRVANGDIRLDNGRICGLRPNSRVVTSNNSITLTEYDHTIVFNVASGTVHVYLPSSPKDGQEYDIYTCHAAMDITIHTQGGINMYDFINAIDHTEASYRANKRRHIHIFYSGGQWWEDYRYLE